MGVDDNIGEFVAKKSNVLFVLTGDFYNMSGVAPIVQLVDDWYDYTKPQYKQDAADWNVTKSRYGLEFKDIVELTKSTTFGNGMLPSVSAKNVTKNNNYGRDLDESNNYTPGAVSLQQDMDNHKQSYYFPFTGRDNPLKEAFSAQTTEYLT
ncbi:MAG: hypothetical protein LBO21_00405, partial [Synergistaceae bacterium]|nr:hypothetical protein [Synergistaceae bacterium]